MKLDGKHAVVGFPNFSDAHIVPPEIGDRLLDHLTVSFDVSRG